jgi:hypothetical protein
MLQAGLEKHSHTHEKLNAVSGRQALHVAGRRARTPVCVISRAAFDKMMYEVVETPRRRDHV